MKILVRLPNWLGDIVMSTAFIKALGEMYPQAEIHAIVKEEFCTLIGWIPSISTLFPFSKSKFRGIFGVYRFGNSLRLLKYDMYFALPDSFSSALMGWASGAKVRIGFQKEGRSLLMTHSFKKPVSAHRVDEYVSLLEQYLRRPIEQRFITINFPKNKIRKQPLLLVNFNSEASSRRMPPQKGRQLLMALLLQFPEIQIGLLGSSKEIAYVSYLQAPFSTYKNLVNYAGRTNLTALVKLIAQSTALLTTDSGPAHLANSLGIPMVVLFGAGSERNTGPYNKENTSVIRAGKLFCEPCIKNKCKFYQMPKCLELLNEQYILQKVKLCLQNAIPGSC